MGQQTKEVTMRTIGVDLAVQGAHKAIVADERGHYITPVLKFYPEAEQLDWLITRAREGAEDLALLVVMEPTGMAWFPVAVYMTRHNIPCWLVSSRQVADLRRFYKRHAKSDQIDVRIQARLPLINPDKLHRLALPSAASLACQRGCKELDRLRVQATAIQNRLLAVDRFAWPGLEKVFPDAFSPAACWFRQYWYNPARVCQAGGAAIRQSWLASCCDEQDQGTWVDALLDVAAEVVQLYGSKGKYLDFELLQAEVRREQEHLTFLQRVHQQLKVKTVRALYRSIHPSRNLETIKGVGQDGAAVYASFVGDASRFPSTRHFRGWSGMVPNSKQSADSESKGLSITQAGPKLIKKFAYLDAEVARRYDPQIAAIYYDQMVHKGKHHRQAVCACATHLLDRVLAVMRQDRPYQLRDVDGTPVSAEQARAIIAQRYVVPEEVRKRNRKRARRERADRRAERKRLRESRPRVR
jgi:transposase